MTKCLIDTNSLLHFTLFSEIDWPEILNTTDVDLVFCAAVIRELDRLKFAEPDIEIRNRCKKVVSKIGTYVNDSKVRDHVRVEFLASEVHLDWSAEGLDREIPDDRIVATAIKLSAEFDTVLVTADIGMILKAKIKQVNTIQLPESLALRDKKSKVEAENAALKARVAFLEKRSPLLVFGVLNEEQIVSHMRKNWKREEVMSAQAVQATVSSARAQLSKYATPPTVEGKLAGLAKLAIPDAAEYERYKRDLDVYLENLGAFLQEDWSYREKLTRLCFVDLALENKGSVPADEVEIRIHFPDGFELLQEHELFQEPKRSREPMTPKSLFEQVGSLGSQMYTFPMSPAASLLRSLNVDPGARQMTLQVKKTNSYDVKIHLKKLMHTTRIQLDRLYLYFESYESIKGFQCSYKIIANNCPEELSGSLSFSFEEATEA